MFPFLMSPLPCQALLHLLLLCLPPLLLLHLLLLRLRLLLLLCLLLHLRCSNGVTCSLQLLTASLHSLFHGTYVFVMRKCLFERRLLLVHAALFVLLPAAAWAWFVGLGLGRTDLCHVLLLHNSRLEASSIRFHVRSEDVVTSFAPNNVLSMDTTMSRAMSRQ
jgi:hypothetical protein